MLSRIEENLYTLMHLTGISEKEATALLNYKVRVISAELGVFPALAADVRKLLERTVLIVDEKDECDIEIAIGIASTFECALNLSLSDDMMQIRSGEQDFIVSQRTHIAGITRKGCACFAAGFVLSRLVKDSLPCAPGDSFELIFANLSFPVEEITERLNLKDSVLAGGGGVANGLLWALEELQPYGSLVIVDPKRARPGNTNRCLYFQEDDSDFKAELLAQRVTLPNVKITPIVGTLKNYVSSRPDQRLPRLICTADSREVRRSFQNELPLEVFDASTTDVSALVIHSHEQPTGHACLSCIYPHVPDENLRDKHIAETLGLTIEDVKKGFIDEATAEKLCLNFPELHRDQLVNMAFDSLHKALCGQKKLITPGSEQTIAPFSFISNLAGVLLALEIYRHQIDYNTWKRSNYMCLDPWVGPHKLLRRLRGRLSNCEFCSNPLSIAALKTIWPELEPSLFTHTVNG
jgi:molybdopterin/thiamine biosynthesis adenylyltransferase